MWRRILDCRCPAGLLVCFALSSGAQEPVFLSGSKPAILTVGELNEIELLIRNHGKLQSIHFHGLEDSVGISAYLSDGGGSDRWEIQVGNQLEEGVYSYHAVSSRGVSNPAFLMLSGWPSIPAKEIRDANMPIPIQTWVSGGIGAGSEDVYPVNLESGREYCIGVMARGLGSRLRAVLGLRDSTGRLIREVQIGELMEGVSVPVSGLYNLSVSDHSYEGGDQYFYEAVVVQGEKMPQPWRDEMKSLLYRRGPLAATVPELPQETAPQDFIDHSTGNDSHKLPWNRVFAADSPGPYVIRSAWTGEGTPFRLRYRTVSSGRYRVEVVSYRLGVPSIPQLSVYRLGSDDAGTGIDSKSKVAQDRPGLPAYKFGDLNFAHADPGITFSAGEGEEFGIVVEDTGVPVSEYGTKSFYLLINKMPEVSPGRVILQPLPYSEPNKRQMYPFPLNLLPGQRIPVRMRVLPGVEADEGNPFHFRALPTGMECTPASVTWPVGGGEFIVLFSAAADARAVSDFIIHTVDLGSDSRKVEVFGTYGPQWKVSDYNNEYAEPSLVRGFYGAITGDRVAPVVAHLRAGNSDPGKRADTEGIEIISGEKLTLTLELRRSEHFTGEVTFKGYGPYSKLPDIKVGAGENSASIDIDTGKLGWKPGKYHPFMHASIKSVIPYVDSGSAEPMEQDKKEYPFEVYTSAVTISISEMEKGGESTANQSE